VGTNMVAAGATTAAALGSAIVVLGDGVSPVAAVGAGFSSVGAVKSPKFLDITFTGSFLKKIYLPPQGNRTPGESAAKCFQNNNIIFSNFVILISVI